MEVIIGLAEGIQCLPTIRFIHILYGNGIANTEYGNICLITVS